jgi:hypothetical protein
MFEPFYKLINLINFGELKLPSFLLNVSPSFIAPVKLAKCQTTNENFDLIQQQQYGKSHLTHQLIILPLMIKILNHFIKMIDLKTNPNMMVSSNYSKLNCSIEYMNDKRYLMSPGIQNTATATMPTSPTSGVSPMGFSFDCIIYVRETDKINQILKDFINNNSSDPIIDQSFILKSDLNLRTLMSFTNHDDEETDQLDISHKDSEADMSPPIVVIHDDEHHNHHTTDKKRQSPKRHHPNKSVVKLNCEDSCNNSIVPDIRGEAPTEKKRRKRRKKNHRGGLQICHNNNNNNNTVDKMILETTNKKKRRKYKKRQRNYDRDTKSEWLQDQNKVTAAVAATPKHVQTTTICEKLFGNRNEQTNICVSFKKLPPSIPLTSPLTFSHQPPQQATRQRQISECSNDSLEICFLDDCDIDGMLVDYDDDDDEDDEDEIDAGSCSLQAYRRMQHRLCGNVANNDETDSDSGFREEKKVRFDLKPKIHVMRTWDFAHRQARIGEWETLARDRVRFTDRIKKLESIIAPVLSREHRDKIVHNRFM